jgi:hypothetical protein
VFWVTLPSGINANANVVVNMTFLPTGTEYDGVYAGECPTCNSIYAKYDNGANVFSSLYQNFAGSSVPAGWQSSGATISNGATLGSSPTYILTSATYAPNPNAVVDFDADFVGTTTRTNLIVGYTNPGDTACYGWSVASTIGSSVYDFGSGSCSGGTPVGTLAASKSAYHVFSVINPNPSSLIMSYDYGQQDSSIGAWASAQNIGAYAYETQPLYLQWVRMRAYPPSGVMPTQSFGTIVP